MAIIKKFSPFQNLTNFQVFENDDLQNSEYFRITELSESLTGGKNGFLIEGSVHLRESTEVKIEILDVEGNPIYFEPGDGVPEYYEGNSKLISVHVYDDTPIGIGKITVLGELKTYIGDNNATINIPGEWKKTYNVKWERSIQVNKNLSNEAIVRFYKKPNVTIDEIVKPIFTKNIPQITQTGTVVGVPLNPPAGTDLSSWRASTQYKLVTDNSKWTSSIDENVVSIPSLNYYPIVSEVLSETEVVVDTPYTSSNGIVSEFATPENYTSTFEYIEGQTITDSALTGSFAKINFKKLKTFVGDVARVKVFRKSRNAVGDFQFVQESKLESSELLRDITTNSDTELSYGRFDETNLSNYWVTSSNAHPVNLNSTVLNSSLKIDYDENVGGVQTLFTSESFSITKDVEYTLNFKTLLSGALDDSNKTIRVYFSGSNYEQNFLTASGSAIYRTRQNLSQNILASNTISDAHLKFDIVGSDWYLSNVSLKNAQDTSFSPDEFTLIQDIPRKLAIETFDFKFEFYDINNNYIPVDVSTTKAFTGGNDFPSSDKLMTFESDRNAFRFSSGSIGSPPFQQIQFKTATNNLTGSITFASSAFDVDGTYINPASYTGEYPGRLTNPTNAGAIISIANFSGSDDSIRVGSIVYTASIEELEEFETVYRLEDGDNAPQLIVTSNANQFIYEPTTLSPKPSGQSITVRAQRKNLTSFTTPIEVNSGSNTPPLSVPVTDASTGIDTYTISALDFSSSFASNNFDEVTYSFTGSNQFDIDFSDEITLSKVISFDAVSLVLSNESTSFPAKSTGEVTSDFNSSKGNVQMFIGGTQITHDDIADGRAKNTFDITSVSGTNVTADSSSPTTNEYGISAFENLKDSGSLSLNIEYLAGDNTTSQSFQKVVSYTKSKNSVPNVEVSVTPSTQTINANSVGSGSVSPSTITVSAKEGGTSRFTSIGTVVYGGGLSGTVSTNTITFTSNASNMTSDGGTVTIPVNFTDSEGTSGTKNIIANVTRVRNAQPTISVQSTPVAQTVAANSSGTMTGNIQDITITSFEGGTEMSYNQSATLAKTQYKITNVTHNQGSVSDVTIADTTPNTNVIEVSSLASTVTNAILTATISYRDSEGTLGTQTSKFNIAKLSEASAGLIIEAEPQTQTVNSNADFSSVDTPSPVLVHVYEDGTPLPYDSTSPYTHGSFYINSTTGGTLTKVEGATSASVQPTTPSSSSSINGFVNVVITDSSGFAATSRKKNFSVAVSVTGDTGIDAVSVTPSISNQNIVRTNTGTFGAPVNISLSVIQGATTFAYDDSSPYAVSTFYIDNIANCTNNDDGTITPDTPSSIAPVTSTYDVTYKDSEGTVKTQSFTHVTTVTLDGNTGPGIVHTGLWEASRAYQFDDGNSGNPGVARRDSVLYSGTYYAATAQHTSTASGTTGPPGVGSNWESLGSQDLFVAAKIAIFEESYVQNTLNVGTNDNGGVSTANITLHGGSTHPYFSLGQTTQGVYGAAGIFIGSFDNSGTTNYRQSLVNSDGSRYLKWDGSNLEIAGSITITGGNAATNDSVTTAGANAVTSGSNAASTAETNATNAGQTAAANAATSASNAQNSADTAQNTADGINANTGSLINPSTYSFGSVLELASASAQTGLNLTSQFLGYYDGTKFASFMGSDGGFYLGGTSGALQWDGSTLAISGEVVITGGATSASLAAATLAAAAAQSTADGIVPGDANPSSYAFGGTGFTLASSTAQTGLNLNSSFLGYHNGTEFQTYMANNGDFFLSGSEGGLTWDASTEALTVNGSGTFTGTLSGGSVIGGTLSVPTEQAPKFHVDADGNMSAQDANISGSFNIEAGTLGGWVIDPESQGGAFRNEDSSLLFDPIRPEISGLADVGAGLEKKLSLHPLNEWASATGGNQSFSVRNNGGSGAWTQPSNPTSGNSSSTVYNNTLQTDLGGNIVVPQAGTFSITGLYGLSSLTISTPSSVSQNTSYPSYNPTYQGQYHGGGASAKSHQYQIFLRFTNQSTNAVTDVAIQYHNANGIVYQNYYQAVQAGYGLHWQYTSYTQPASSSTTSFTAITKSVTLVSGTYSASYLIKKGARSGYSQNVVASTGAPSTITYYTTTMSASNIGYNASSATLVIPSNLVELSSRGLQVLTDSTAYVQINRNAGASSSNVGIRVQGQKTMLYGGGTYPAGYNNTRALEVEYGYISCKGIQVGGFGGSNSDPYNYGFLTLSSSVLGNIKNTITLRGDLDPAKTSWTSTTANTNRDMGSTTFYWDSIYADDFHLQSDERAKENISDSQLGLDFINEIRPVQYSMKESSKKRTRYGFIAQEISSSLDNAGLTTQDFKGLSTGSSEITRLERDYEKSITEIIDSGSYHTITDDTGSAIITQEWVDDKQANTMWNLSYLEFIAPLTKAVQELSAKVTQLENQISGSL
tara:strand:- start:1915 stop:9147 length:7233 start_codon:yes stop_codon:yes gene_type:complete